MTKCILFFMRPVTIISHQHRVYVRFLNRGSALTVLYTEQTHLDNLFYDWTHSATKLFTQLLKLDLGNSCALQYDVAVY